MIYIEREKKVSMFVNPQIDYFTPERGYIASITPISSEFTLITTTSPTNFKNGLVVNFVYPESYGMTRLLQYIYYINVIDSTRFVISVDTRNETPFVIPANAKQSPQVLPYGSIDSLENAVRNHGNMIPTSAWVNTPLP